MTAAAALFQLSEADAERLANRAGLSLSTRENRLAQLLKDCGSIRRRQIYYAAVSERMVQYYIAGREPSKQTLLAIGILLELPIQELERLLQNYGYCLSNSLANDTVVRWYLEHNGHLDRIHCLDAINETLEELGLPLLMAQSDNKKI